MSVNIKVWRELAMRATPGVGYRPMGRVMGDKSPEPNAHTGEFVKCQTLREIMATLPAGHPARVEFEKLLVAAADGGE